MLKKQIRNEVGNIEFIWIFFNLVHNYVRYHEDIPMARVGQIDLQFMWKFGLVPFTFDKFTHFSELI